MFWLIQGVKEINRGTDENGTNATPGLVYNKLSENLIEIVFAFAGIWAAHEKLCETDSITWKQMFVDWANEFETVHADDDWNQNDYLDEIKRYAQQKILEYAGLDG